MHPARCLALLGVLVCLPCFGQDLVAIGLGPVTEPDGILFEMGSRVTGMAASADGRYLATVADSGELRIWDFDASDVCKRTSNKEGALNAVAFHHKEPVVAFGGAGARIHVLDLESDLRKTLDGALDGTTALTFFDGGVAAGGADGTVRFFHSNLTGVLVGKEKHRGKVKYLTSTVTPGTRALPHGTPVVVSTDEEGWMRLWNEGNCMLRKRSGGRGIRFAQFVSQEDAALLLVGGTPGRGRWLNIGLKDNYGRYCQKYPVLVKKTLSRNGRVAEVMRWETKTVCTQRYTGSTPVLKEISAASGYPVGDTLALMPGSTSVASAGRDSIDLLHLPGGSSEASSQEIVAIDEPVDLMVWSHDARRLFTASPSGSIRAITIR